MLTRIFALSLLLAVAADAAPDEAARLTRTAEAIRDADYRGDRAELRRLASTLDPIIIKGARLKPYALYWRGFAQWRRAMNGFNETPAPADLKDGSAEMNTWLHKAVLQRIAKHGGNIPKHMLD